MCTLLVVMFSDTPKSYEKSKYYPLENYLLCRTHDCIFRPCPLCRCKGPFVPVSIPSRNVLCSSKPTHVFNPCGHAASEQVSVDTYE